MITCLNCGHTYEGNFCPHCGQKAKTKRVVGWKYLWNDILYFLHYNKKLPFTIGQLMSRPGPAIREFIEGKRVKYYMPLSFVLLLGGFYGLLLYLNHISPLNLISQVVYKVNDVFYADEFEFPKWLVENFASLELFLFLPVFSVASYLAFFRSPFKFSEHLVINAFLSGQRLFIGILTFPLLYFFYGRDYSFLIEGFINFIEFAFTFWAYIILFKEHNESKYIFFSLLTFVLVILQLLFLEFIWWIFV